MTIRSMAHTLVALMVVSTFSMPFTTLAQQKSVQNEVSETAAEQDRKPTILEIKATAEQDANDDTNALLWFSVGLGIAYVATGTGLLASEIVGNEIGIFVGAAGALAIITLIYKSTAQVPAGRLIGKSPEYVEFYTDVYHKKTRFLQTGWTVAGVVAAYGVPIGCLWIVSQ